MAVMFDKPFVAAEVKDDNKFDLLPAGDYLMQVTESKIEATKAGTGKMLVLTLEILDGQYAGRKLWDRLNIENPNPKAEEISLISLKHLCESCGKPGVNDSEELHLTPFKAKVGIRKDKTGQYSDQNSIRYSGKPNGTATTAPKETAAKPWSK